MTELYNNLPPGWDCRFDKVSGRYYYINHYTKSTTWDDPRNRHRPFHAIPSHSKPAGEYIPLQHGSPELRRNFVYPSQTSPIPAFQMPAHMNPKSIPLQDIRPKMSPLSVKSSRVKDTSLTTTDTDEAVAKISALFPTVSETHIKMLMKNCRYMKSVFPQADENIILEVLQNNENNIQKTSETLTSMGFEKKDTLKVAQQKLEAKMEQKREEEKIESEVVTPPQIKLKTNQEKKQMKIELQEKYKDVAEHLISIALESVDFDEGKASQILQTMIKEDSENVINGENRDTSDSTDAPSTSDIVSTDVVIPISQSRQSLKSLMKAEKEMEKLTFSRVIEECENGHRSSHLSNTKGPDPDSAKGANEKILLESYVKWQGTNSSIRKGPQGIAMGPNADLISTRKYQACGANKDFAKGPKFGLAKGSIFSQLRVAVTGESRGK